MRDQDIRQIIEQKNPERKEALRKKVDERLSFTTVIEQPQNKSVFSSFKKSHRIIASVSATLVVACFAIILPILLNRDTGPTERYCNVTDCVETVSDYTLKEYSELNNLSLLYIDWYDIADEIQTKVFVNTNNSSDIIYFEETLVNGESGSIATLYITELHTRVDIFENIKNNCDNIKYISSIKVSWSYQNFIGFACFEYSGRSYVINLEYPMAEDSVLELAESMIPNE